MIQKYLLIILIVFFLTLLVSIVRSRKRLWNASNTMNSRIFTLRAIVIVSIIVLFLVFSLFR